MKKLILVIIFAAIFISPALGDNVTIEALDPDKGKMLVTYSGKIQSQDRC